MKVVSLRADFSAGARDGDRGVRAARALGVETSGVPGQRSLANRRSIYAVKRAFDLLLVFIATVILALPIVLVALLVKLTSRGPAIYWSRRVGRYNRTFMMPKFRSMRVGTPTVATHLMTNPEAHLTPIGSFVRRTSLDELPQLWSIWRGHMSFVGPRPALFNQDDLVAARTVLHVHELLPGLTGWAQVNGRDELPISEKVALDAEYLRRRSFLFDLRILWMTALNVMSGKGVAH
jgi:O-antigen biosynthesis protein WbqP